MKYLNYILILIGAVVAMYTKAGTNQNQYILMVGIIILMTGIYRISRTIPSKYEIDDNNGKDK